MDYAMLRLERRDCLPMILKQHPGRENHQCFSSRRTCRPADRFGRAIAVPLETSRSVTLYGALLPRRPALT